MAILKAKWIQKDPNTLIDDAGSLKVKIDPAGDLEATTEGLRIKPGAVVKPDGSVAFTGDQSMGGHRLTDLAIPVDQNDATPKQYVDAVVSNLNVRETEVFELSSTDITNKYVQLSFEPIVHEETIVYVNGAPGQDYGTDYAINVVSGTAYLTWNGLGLDGKLQPGDTMVVVYDRTNVSGGVHDQFIGLDDTPNSYTGFGGYYVVVKETENGLEFREPLKWERLLTPEAFTLDDTYTGVDSGKLFNIYTTVNFSESQDGAIWFQFDFPSWSWDVNKDILFDFIFSCAGNAAGQVVKLDAKFWLTANGETDDPSTPDYSVSEDITVSTDMEGKRYRQTMTNIKIPASVITTSNCSIACQLKRDTSVANNYPATFQLLHIIAYQN